MASKPSDGRRSRRSWGCRRSGRDAMAVEHDQRQVSYFLDFIQKIGEASEAGVSQQGLFITQKQVDVDVKLVKVVGAVIKLVEPELQISPMKKPPEISFTLLYA